MATVFDGRVPRKQILNYRGCIKINVGLGVEQDSFDVHEVLLTTRSPFFKKAMDGDWKEANERVVNFPEDDPETFKTYIHLLYTGNLAVQPDPIPDKYRGNEEYVSLAKLYVLAERIQDIETKNAALKAFIISARETRADDTTCLPGLRTICIIYDGTPAGSLARKALVDLYSVSAGSRSMSPDIPSYPEEFLYELLSNVLDKRPRDPKKLPAISKYVETKASTSTRSMHRPLVTQ